MAVDIQFANNKIRKRCLAAKGKLRQRLDDIRAVSTIEELLVLPGHFHRLGADRSGQWACHLNEPYRLVFEVIMRSGGTAGGQHPPAAVRVIEVVNYHER